MPPDQVPAEADMEGVKYKQVGPLVVAWQSGDLIVTSGAETLRKVVRVINGVDSSIARNDRYAAACKKTMGGREFLMAHWNVEKTRAILAEKRGGDDDGAEKFWGVLGFKDVNYVHLSIAPDAPGVKLMLYAHAPQGAKGILKALPTRPVDEKAMLAGVPETASDFAVARFSPGEAYDALAEMMEKTQDKDDFNEGIADFNKGVGFDLRKDLLASLGDEVLFRCIGPGFLVMPEFYLSIDVKDEKKLASCLDKLVAAVNDEGRNQNDDDHIFKARPKLGLDTLDYKGNRIAVFKFLRGPIPLAPSYCIVKGRALIALTPQVLKRALDVQAAPARPILNSNAYAALRSHVAAKASVLYYDEFKQGFDGAYGGLAPYLVQMLNGIPDVPPHSLGTKFPSANAITPHLFGTVSALSHDGEGYLLETYGPFGGGLGASPGTALLGVQAGWLLPAFARTGTEARRAACMNNIRQIGLSLIQYAGDHDDKFPADMGVLLHEGYLSTPKVFFCPSDRKAKLPNGFPEGDYKAAKLEDLKKVEDFGSYVMTKGITHAADAETIVLYDKPGAHNGQGRTCFFNDGHVRWYPELEFARLMAQQAKRMAEKKRDNPDNPQEE
jgi:hypothetical protein